MPSVVFIFGAGASWDFGAPLMREFMERAETFAGNPRMGCALAKVKAWRSQAISRGALRNYADNPGDKPAPDANNLEDMMCLLDIGGYLFDAADAGVMAALQHLAAECYFLATADELNRTLHELTTQGTEPSSGYAKLVRALRALEDGILWNKRCSFITFNYDVALDAVLARTPAHSFGGLPDGAGFNETDPERVEIARAASWPLYWLGRANDFELQYRIPRLLKLHGSLNWGTCAEPDCDAPIRQFRFFDTIGAAGLSAIDPVHEMAKKPCGYHLSNDGTTRKHKPYIIPPTWKRASLRYALRRVWTQACQDISEATRIVIVGHSLPPTDTYFRYVLARALTSGAEKRVLVVNPNERDSDRYKEFLSSLLPDGSLAMHPARFSDSVDRIEEFVAEIL